MTSVHLEFGFFKSRHMLLFNTASPDMARLESGEQQPTAQPRHRAQPSYQGRPARVRSASL
eukprot:CAMPEP_0115459958 /NCGR_PEP_ID=MMETSP0271-20121206/46528_1 /TAXON_ID=71861 /ORGANISM="Scrippsiella trochoidea, Strain CCMP3099" /LENGTH=60 /DNA_ID=CAMNT_0002886633 /DNA_START=91 /DNA_END=273 /DNA_ORIENTATION=-